ncbi:hypothetical protein [Rhodanobacter lindaniclasticus]
MIPLTSQPSRDDYIGFLAEELLRVTTQGNLFTMEDGTRVEGATETAVITHLTSTRDFIPGRQHRFSGFENALLFPRAIEAAGFRIVRAHNHRGWLCTVITL